MRGGVLVLGDAQEVGHSELTASDQSMGPNAWQRVELARHVLSFFFSSRRRHTRFDCDWSSDVCSSDLPSHAEAGQRRDGRAKGSIGSGCRRAERPTESGAVSSGSPHCFSRRQHYLRRRIRSEEHTSELQSQSNLVCRLLLEKKKPPHETLRLHVDGEPPEVVRQRALDRGGHNLHSLLAG